MESVRTDVKDVPVLRLLYASSSSVISSQSRSVRSSSSSSWPPFSFRWWPFCPTGRPFSSTSSSSPSFFDSLRYSTVSFSSVSRSVNFSLRWPIWKQHNSDYYLKMVKLGPKVSLLAMCGTDSCLGQYRVTANTRFRIAWAEHWTSGQNSYQRTWNKVDETISWCIAVLEEKNA